MGWVAVAGGGTIAGIGFTVSLLIATLAFEGRELDEAKLGILSGAVAASALTWLLFRATALELGYFFGRITPRRLGDLQAIICTFNHYAAAPLAEPFEIETVSHVFGWSLPASVHRHRFFNWNIEHAHFARGSDVTSRAELPRSRRSRRHGNRFGIFKAQLAPGEIRRAIAGQIQHQRLVDAREPDLTLYAPAGAIVDFATQNMLVKPPSHGQKLCRCRDCERTRFLGLGP